MNWTAIKSTCTCIALMAVSYLAITTAQIERTTAKHVNDILMRSSDVVDQSNAALKRINAPGGLLQVTGKAVAKADNLIGHTDILVANEQKSLDKWNHQIDETLTNVNIAVAATTANENTLTQQATQTLRATSDTVESIAPLTASLNDEVTALNTATVGITAMLPDVRATAVNVRGMTEDGHATTTMTKEWLHGILHPTWPERIKNGMLDVLQHLPIP